MRSASCPLTLTDGITHLLRVDIEERTLNFPTCRIHPTSDPHSKFRVPLLTDTPNSMPRKERHKAPIIHLPVAA